MADSKDLNRETWLAIYRQRLSEAAAIAKIWGFKSVQQ